MLEQQKKRKIDDLIDFESLENLMDELMKSFQENSKPGENAEIFGVSIKISKDGKPIMQEFGKQGLMQGFGIPEAREPLVDVSSTPGELSVACELPGVKKEDIDIRVSGQKLAIQASGVEKFFKQVLLPSGFQELPSKTVFNNGILELAFKKKALKKPKGKKVKVD